MHRIVLTSILELLAYPLAHNKSLVWRDRNVVLIKQCMEITSKQQPIGYFVHPLLLHRQNVSRLKSWKGPFSGHNASALVGFYYPHSESTLAESRTYKSWLSKHCLWLCEA